MQWKRLRSPLVLLAACLFVPHAAAWAQPQVTVSTPLHTLNDSFFEHRGIGWGASGNNWFFNFGSPTMSAPAFGGFDPSAGLSFGGAFRRNGVNGFFNGNFSQGHRSSFTSQTPIVTLQNGMPGWVSDSSLSPFVMGFVPIVGGWPTVAAPRRMPPAAYVTPGGNTGHAAVLDRLNRARRGQGAPPDDVPVAQRPARPAPLPAVAPAMPKVARPQEASNDGDELVLVAPRDSANASPSRASGSLSAGSSTASRGAISVAQARRLRAAELAAVQEEAEAFFERGRGAEAAGKANVARLYYERAARRATGPLREQILAKLSALQAP